MSGSLKLQWSDALNTGNRAIDVQHKYLVDIINELAEAIESGSATQNIKKIIHLLQYYTEWHFGREELCMDRFQCPVAAANKAAHCIFIETFLAFRKEYETSGGSEDIAMRMYKTLTDWLVNHIMKVDGQIGPCMHNHPAEA